MFSSQLYSTVLKKLSFAIIKITIVQKYLLEKEDKWTMCFIPLQCIPNLFYSLILEVKESSGIWKKKCSFSFTCFTWRDDLETRKLASFGEYLEFSQLMLRIKELPNSLITLNIQFSSIMNSIFTHIWENYTGKLIYCLLLGFSEYLDVKADQPELGTCWQTTFILSTSESGIIHADPHPSTT